MLSNEEISSLILEDASSKKKLQAKVGQRYYDGEHDILNYRLFYYNSDGELQEDKTRSNIKISHPFFSELVDQTVQYMLSNGALFKSDIPELQKSLDEYFNNSEDFTAELSETLTGCIVKGFDYMYAYKDSNNKIAFQHAESEGIVEVRKNASDKEPQYVIYISVDRIEKNKKINRIQVWDKSNVYYFVEADGKISNDDSQEINPKPHTLYKAGKVTKFKEFGFIPFFRLDNNRKQFSGLKPIKALIDDYDLMACGLSNNIQDSAEAYFVVSGFQGDSLDELIQNVKIKKHIGVDADGGLDVKTVEIPYQARATKLELDEKNIYRFGMGLNTSGLKDTSATTNIAIKAAYSLLDLKCSKLEIRLKQFLRKLLKPVLAEINESYETDYQLNDVYFEFTHEVMSNASENAQIKLTKAQEEQVRINTLLNLQTYLDSETLMQNICDTLDIDYEEIKSKLTVSADNGLDDAQAALQGLTS